jgi:hypothetical protein
LAFSYWINKPWFLTEGKLATVLIIPTSWGSQLGGHPTRIKHNLESVVIAHEIIQGLVFKIDYEKAYDKVNLDFLFEVLELRSFSPLFVRLIKQVTRGGSVDVKVNDEESNFFLTAKGLRQGDPIAPLIFNCVVNVFFRMLVKGTNSGLIRGLCPNFIPGGVVSLQYADDTLLFLEKRCLCSF